MSSQIYEIELFQGHPHKKEILSKEEVIDFCKHYNQHTSELYDFLELHKFEKWACVGISIDATYDRHTKDGRVDCSPTEFLGIMITSMMNDKYQQAINNYIKHKPVDGMHRFQLNEGIYDHELRKEIRKPREFDVVDGCPLWVVQVNEYATYDLSGVVLIPSEFWNANDLNRESAGYGYAVVDKYDHWYNRGFGINFRMLRIGGWSPNFLESIKSDLPKYYNLYDSELNRLFSYPSSYSKLSYFDLHTETLQEIDNFGSEGLYIAEGSYHFYTKKCLIKTDKKFRELGRLDSKTGLIGNQVLQEYVGENWSVILTNKGIEITSHKAHKRDKLSAFKIKAGAAAVRHLLIYALDENYLIFLNDKLTVIDADLNFRIHSIKRKFNKPKLPNLGKTSIEIGAPNGLVELKGSKPFLFSGNVVISFDAHNEPISMNQKLYELTGELCFYCGVVDQSLGGIWLLAGLGRLVFIDEEFKNAFVFNMVAEGSFGSGRYHGSSQPFLHMDKAGNLRFSLHQHNSVQKVAREELVNKLKIAVPFK